MYICICQGVTESQIRRAAADGVASLGELQMQTGCGASCGQCIPEAQSLLFETVTTPVVDGVQFRQELTPNHAAA